MSRTPVATYRLQFRNGMTFDRAVGLVPYLKRLGISHLYASPIFTATSGSTHGYDIVDFNEIDPAIGGREGFERLGAALRDAGLGLILDIVPNHMAASLENRWWRSVIEFGAASPYGRHFDIDWSHRLTLPILGGDFADVLSRGELRLDTDPENGCLALCYFDNRLPLFPQTYRLVAERLGDAGAGLARLADLGSRGEGDVERFRAAARSLFAGPEGSGLSEALDAASADASFIERVHAAQPWRLTFWKDARRDLTYRRFFEVTGLVGVRVEDEAVFEDAHRLVLSLVRSGKVDGLRVDHVDGLARPGSYLKRLRAAVGEDPWLLVEKILGEGERLSDDWHGVGTTGYEFIASVADLLVDPRGLEDVEEFHAAFTGAQSGSAANLRAAKELILTRNFEGELERLVSAAREIASKSGAPGISPEDLRAAIREIVIGFEVYRTYGEDGALSAADMEVLHRAQDYAATSGFARPDAIAFIVELLRGGAGQADDVVDFRLRFQQLTGPVMAKAVEDTLFYRDNAFLALNEVGAAPGGRIGSVGSFHGAMSDRAGRAPGLLATSTHDTKRGEDARARLYVLSERPEAWGQAVRRWSVSNAALRDATGAPGAEVEWLVYQALAGVWPIEADPRAEDVFADLGVRFGDYLRKALREAKQRTDWLEIDEAYESSVLGFAERLLAPESRDFRTDFAITLRPFAEAGYVNALSQVLAKLTAPGVPDIYQGSEGLDLSLVDPDNRRVPDFAALAARLDDLLDRGVTGSLRDGSTKQWLVARCLECRNENPDLFLKGSYVPLEVRGPACAHYPAYLRGYQGRFALVVLQRLPLARRHVPGGEAASISLPASCRNLHFRSVLGSAGFVAAETLAVNELLGDLPVALAVSDR